MKRTAIGMLALLLLSACMTVPMAPVEQDTEAKRFTPPANKASLYIYRNEVLGAAIPMSVAVNGRMLGQTGSQSYFRLNLLPGKYNVESHSENVSSLGLIVEAGKNYYVWQEVKMGFWMARSQLQQVDESTGRAGVMESKLVMAGVLENDVLPLDAPSSSPPAVPAGNSVAQKLRELQNLRNNGVITEEEFQTKRQQLFEKL